jgi:hypothetical protein
MSISKIFISCACLLVLFTSCSSIKSLGAKDHSYSGSSAPTKKPVSGEPKFIDGIAINPGSAKPLENANRPNKIVPKPEIPQSDSAQLVTGLDMDKADWLQVKYSIILDAQKEKLTNLPLLKTIDYWWGTKYCMGGITENCIDCSAFTQTVERDVYNITLPRTAQEQYDNAEKIELNDIKEGDLVFFYTSGRAISHVGVYLMNNKFVHASTSGGVMISDLNDNYWKPRFRGAGRVKAEATSSK